MCFDDSLGFRTGERHKMRLVCEPLKRIVPLPMKLCGKFLKILILIFTNFQGPPHELKNNVNKLGLSVIS